MSDKQSQLRDESPLFVGDYYDGAYGPTIILIASSPNACVWLQDVFRELAHGGANRMLTTEPKMRFTNLTALKLVNRTNGLRVMLRRDDDTTSGKSFVWSATVEGWLYLAELIQPLADGVAGHQYLTEDEDDVAVVELSSGERDVLTASR